MPYVLRAQRASIATVEKNVKILNLGRAAGNTQFDLDMADIPEYDRVRLQLEAKNFVQTAKIQGANLLTGNSWVRLGSGTVYDFSRENLGANAVLKIPASIWRYLRISLGAAVRPEQVKAAFVSNLREEKASWTSAGRCQFVSSPTRNQTLAECALEPAMPVDRIVFQIAPDSVNFLRTAAVQDANQNEIVRCAISRVRMNRNGQTIASEDLNVDLPSVRSRQLKIIVENGDNAPLPIQTVQVLSTERRLYFDPQGKTAVQLYYGDPKLQAATYDYAAFFQEDAAAAQAQIGPAQSNPAYTGRPDDRPWSERHKAVLWTAMILVVAILAVMALKGLRGAPTTG